MPFDFLVVEGGHTRTLPFPAARFLVGSDGQCALRFAPNQVQPRHAEIQVTDDRAFLTDLTGKGLTWVNGMPVEKGELQAGMLVRFGRVELMVRHERAEAGEAPARGAPLATDELAAAHRASPNPQASREAHAPAVEAPPVASASADPPGTPREGALDATARRPTPFREAAPAPAPAEAAPAAEPEQAASGEEEPPPATKGGTRSLTVGTIVDDRYLILARLAAGGMGEVYKAQHVELGKLMAMKVMRRQLSQDAEFVARFKREAIATSGIGQTNIVDISDFGRTEDGRFYFIMEYLDGMTLASLLHREGAQPVQRVLAIAVQIARALSAAHTLGVIHRDLKPENVMLLQRHGQRDFVKVVDFGVAKLPVAQGIKGHTAVGMVVGTPQYMSPEQAKAVPVDARSDIYSLGLIIHELLAGKPTFDAETPASLMVKQVTEPPPPLELGAEAPEGLMALIDSMLAKSPRDRPQTMAEVVEALEGFLGLGEGRGSLAGLQSTPVRSSPLRTPTLQARTLKRPTPSEAAAGKLPQQGEALGPDEDEVALSLPRSRAPLYAAAVALGVGVLGGLGWWLSQRPESEPSSSPPLVDAPREGPGERERGVPVAPSEAPPVRVVEAPAPPAEVRLRLASTPRGAAVYEGEVKLGTTPLTVSKATGRTAELRFVLEGYQVLTRRFDFAVDQDVAVELVTSAALHAPGGPPPRKAPGTKATRAPASAEKLFGRAPSEAAKPPEDEAGERATPAAEERAPLPTLVDDPYADDKNQQPKALKDVAY